jgi:soluble lytic murein transglycosylase-like protein
MVPLNDLAVRRPRSASAPPPSFEVAPSNRAASLSTPDAPASAPVARACRRGLLDLLRLRSLSVAGALIGALGASAFGAPLEVRAEPIRAHDTIVAHGESARPRATFWTNIPNSPASPAERAASYASAEADLARMRVLRPAILRAAERTGVDPALIAGLVSRESRAGAALDERGIGDRGRGYGITQINHDDFARLLARHDWRDPQTNFELAMTILKSNRTELERLAAKSRIPFDDADLILWTVSSYNAGPAGALKGLIRHRSADAYTTGKDYAKDVLARAEYFRARGFVSGPPAR